jgi:glycosyltransferase involved in cell wall biosynthesis
MKFYQMVGNIVIGDAIGNEVIMLDKLIRKMGFETCIFYETATEEAAKISSHYSIMPEINNKDIVLYHYASATKITYVFCELKCRKILRYHNVTPPVFFLGYDTMIYSLCQKGLKEVQDLSNKVDYCLAVSEFNKIDLENMGFTCKIDVLPILLPYEDYMKTPSEKIINKYSDGTTNIISVGRIFAPNKRWENIIKTFYFYQKYVDKNSRLFLVGSYGRNEIYPQRLMSYVKDLELKNVIFTGHIPFDEILAYYRIADVYLCMSEHEGFCVPLLEAMLFNKPIIAYSTTAIPYTLDGAGFLLEKNDPLEAALIIERILKDRILRDEILKKQNERLLFFETQRVSEMFKQCIEDFIECNYNIS